MHLLSFHSKYVTIFSTNDLYYFGIAYYAFLFFEVCIKGAPTIWKAGPIPEKDDNLKIQ